MSGVMIRTFVAGCCVGAAVNDLARWQHQRSAAQNLLRGLDSGTVYYGRDRRSASLDQNSMDQH
jgi:hypothetical protein